MARIAAEVRRDTAAGAFERLDAKIDKLAQFLPIPGSSLEPFFASALHNHTLRDTDLDNALRFLQKKTGEERERIGELLALCFPPSNSCDLKKKSFLHRVESLRLFTAKLGIDHWDPTPLCAAARVLGLDFDEVLTMVRMRPKILRGLRKPPRPIYAWPLPLLLASLTVWLLIAIWPMMPLAVLCPIMLIVLIGSLSVLCTRIAVAPGVLCYDKTSKCLTAALRGSKRGDSAIRLAMVDLGIDVEEYSRTQTYENRDVGVRIVIRDKRTAQGAVEFLTSSEAVGNCIALRSFVAWTMPSYLDDDGIMLADLYHRGSRGSWSQRGQVWMVAAQCRKEPVLVVNSVELNNEGAKYLESLLPQVIAMLRDIARRGRFKQIYIGLSEFGRGYLDRHFAQGKTLDPIDKVHSPDAGYRYHFDVFRLGRRNGELRFKYVKSRSLVARCYSILFGAIEWLSGRRQKAATFFDSARNAHNFWSVPLDETNREG